MERTFKKVKELEYRIKGNHTNHYFDVFYITQEAVKLKILRTIKFAYHCTDARS